MRMEVREDKVAEDQGTSPREAKLKKAKVAVKLS